MKQTICLNMIVKNEAHVIEETLNNICKYVDYYVITDTGSTDNTKEIITTFFNAKNIKGEIYDHEFRTCSCHNGIYKKYDWFHFGWNRTYSLDKCIGKSDYILIMDADDLIIGDLPVRNAQLNKDCYEFKIGTSFVYYRPQLIRNDARLGWKYIGGLHEYIDASVPKSMMRLDGNYHMESRRLGSRNNDSNKYKKDANVFIELLKDNPLNDRYMFYCAQSFCDCGEHDNAIKYYEKRVRMGGFTEEVYFSLYKIAQCKQALKYSHADIVSAYMRCYKYYPRRVEPLYEIIKMCRLSNKFAEGYSYVNTAMKVKYPVDNVLFVSKSVYDYQLADEASICAFYCGKYREAKYLVEQVINNVPNHDKNRYYKNLECANASIKGRPLICFYVGYTPDYVKSDVGAYGSELALKKISELLAEMYDVYIFGTSFTDKVVNGVNFKNSNDLNDFANKNEISVMVVSRYVHYFINHTVKAMKTYIWLHDVTLQPYWNYLELHDCGANVLRNAIDKIDGVITLCEWHKEYVMKKIGISNDKMFVIGNGVDINNFNASVDRIKNRFIYMSNPNRGLYELVNYFHTIRKNIPTAELYVYRGLDEFEDKEYFDKLKQYDYIHYMGKYNSADLAIEMMKAEYWFYPTNFHETYCISALEVQLAGCIPITSSIGALLNTVGDRGILIKNLNIYSQDYWDEGLKHILELNSNEDLKEQYRNKCRLWAIDQTWDSRSNEWVKLFSL